MSEMLQIVLDATSRILTDHCTPEVMERADAGEWPTRLWHELTEAGVTMAGLSEERGGAGLGIDELAAIMRLAGYFVVPIPLAETLAASRVLGEQSVEIGDGPIAVAAHPGAPTLQAVECGGDWALDGSCARVPWGNESQLILASVTTRRGDLIACFKPSQARCIPGRNMAFEPRPTLQLQGTEVGPNAVFACPDDVPSMLALGAFVRSQQLAGAAQRCLDLSASYAAERVQFGRPIAKFQAIQQQLAVMAGQVAAASAAADAAVAQWDSCTMEFAVAVAKARTGEAAGQVAAIAHQVHGAIGFTREHRLHYATRRLWSWREEFGNEAYWSQYLGAKAFDLGADNLWPFIVDRP